MWFLATSQSQEVSELRLGPGRLSPEPIAPCWDKWFRYKHGSFVLVGRGKEDRRDPGTPGRGSRGPGSPWECIGSRT